MDFFLLVGDARMQRGFCGLHLFRGQGGTVIIDHCFERSCHCQAVILLSDGSAYTIVEDSGVSGSMCLTGRERPAVIDPYHLTVRPVVPEPQVQNEICLSRAHAAQDNDCGAAACKLVTVHFVRISFPARVIRR